MRSPPPRARGIRKAVAPGARFGIFVVLLVLAEPHPHYGFRARVQCSICGHEQESFLARLRYDAPIYHRGCTSHPHERRWSDMAGRKHVEAVQRLAPETQAAIVAIVNARGIAPAATVFRTSTSTIDRILGSGLVRRDTATRLDERARELGAGKDS